LPRIDQVVPKEAPLFSFRVSAKLLAEALLTFSDLLSDEYQGVDVFFYGEGRPLGICARDSETGAFIDALVVPLEKPAAVPAKPEEADEPPVEEQAEEQPVEPVEEPPVEEPPAEQPRKKRRRKVSV
jgi:hypothetical protein